MIFIKLSLQPFLVDCGGLKTQIHGYGLPTGSQLQSARLEVQTNTTESSVLLLISFIAYHFHHGRLDVGR